MRRTALNGSGKTMQWKNLWVEAQKTVQSSIEDGGIVDFTGQDRSENAIWDRIHKKIFHLAEQAPICQGQLQGDFVYLANTPATSQFLAGIL